MVERVLYDTAHTYEGMKNYSMLDVIYYYDHTTNGLQSLVEQVAAAFVKGNGNTRDRLLEIVKLRGTELRPIIGPDHGNKKVLDTFAAQLYKDAGNVIREMKKVCCLIPSVPILTTFHLCQISEV